MPALRPWRWDPRSTTLVSWLLPDWTGIGSFVVTSILAVALTAWQVQADRSVFERYFGAMRPAG